MIYIPTVEELQNKVTLAVEVYNRATIASSAAENIHHKAKLALKNMITCTSAYNTAVALAKSTDEASIDTVNAKVTAAKAAYNAAKAVYDAIKAKSSGSAEDDAILDDELSAVTDFACKVIDAEDQAKIFADGAFVEPV